MDTIAACAKILVACKRMSNAAIELCAECPMRIVEGTEAIPQKLHGNLGQQAVRMQVAHQYGEERAVGMDDHSATLSPAEMACAERRAAGICMWRYISIDDDGGGYSSPGDLQNHLG
jgi:hypothetical protein